MEDLKELLELLLAKYPTKDKKGRPTWVDKEPITIGELKELLKELVNL